MNPFVRAAALFALLSLLVCTLIFFPSMLLGVWQSPQALIATAGYIVFFSTAVWRGAKHGNFVKSKDDKQVQNTSGKFAAVLRSVGLLGVHWLALYTFSRLDSAGVVGVSASAAVGVALMAIAFAVNVLAIRSLGRFWDKLVIKENHRVVSDGIYSVIRHPIYTSYIVLFIGYCLLFESAVSLVVLAAVCAVWFGSRISIEETMLEEQFGDEYRTYMKRTKRLFPFVY
jgi:protein-S-isoprenylcysteine O-methyltransferase Ste14